MASTGQEWSFKTRFILFRSAILAQERRFLARGKRYSIPPARLDNTSSISYLRVLQNMYPVSTRCMHTDYWAGPAIGR